MKDALQDLFKPASFIGGQWITRHQTFGVYNKTTGQKLIDVADATTQDMQLAITAAHNAFDAWSDQPAKVRGELLRAWFNLITDNKDELAQILSLEQGKPIAEANAEIDYGAAYIEWFAEEARRSTGDIIQSNNAHQQLYAYRKPVGVVAAITPWNFPNAMITRKAAAALAAGCTFVVKPAHQTPLSALALAHLAQQAGIPDGVINVVTGTHAQDLGLVMTQSPEVAKLSFTGSTAIGKTLTADCANTMKRVSMELGGNAPFIVFDDADIDAAVTGAMIAKFRNAGQTCVCANRFIVSNAIKAQFITALLDQMQTLQSGDSLDATTTIGPLISEQAALNVHSLVTEAVTKGANVHVGGEWSQGAFYPPTVLSNVTKDMAIFQREIFGPVVTIIGFDTEAQAIALANDTQYGLAGYFYAQNLSRIHRVANALQFGMIGINEGAISNPAAPFGGIKESGYGREGSKYGLDDYTFIQYRCLGGLSNG